MQFGPARLGALAFLAGIGVLLARAPRVLLEPRFWAEESDFFFAQAMFLSPLEALVENPGLRAGYLNLFPSLAAIVGAAGELERAPLATLAFSLLLQLAALALIAWGRRDVLGSPFQRVLLVAVWYFFPYASGTSEVWLNTINAQVWLGMAALLILIGAPDGGSSWQRWSSRVILLLSGLSGPYGVALVPLFAHAAWRQRDPERRVQFLLLGVALLLQLAAFAYAHTHGMVLDEKDPTAWHLGRLYAAVVYQAGYAVVGEMGGLRLLAAAGMPSPAEATAATGVATGALVACLVVLAALVAPWAVRQKGGLAMHYPLLAALTWLGMTTVFSVDGLAGFRYAVAPSFALGLAAAIAASDAGLGSIRRAMAGALLAAGISTGVYETTRTPALATGRHGHAVNWKDEVAAWRRDPDSRLRNWPHPGWYTHLPDPVRLESLRRVIDANGNTAQTIGAARVAVLDVPRGLPAMFSLLLEVCRAPDTPTGLAARVDLSGPDGEVYAAVQLPLPEHCQQLELNSMELSFAGFHHFAETTSIGIVLAATPPGAAATLTGVTLRSPVIYARHRLSGRNQLRPDALDETARE